MRIGIDIRALGKKRTGDETYIYNLVKALSLIDQKNEYFLFSDSEAECPSHIDPKIYKFNDNFQVKTLWAPQRLLWTPISLALAVKYYKLDLIQVTYSIPIWSSAKVITTIHDITFRILPHTFPFKDQLILNNTIRFAARKADAIITGSQCTKEDLVKFFKANEDKITVIPYGVDFSVYNTSPKKAVAPQAINEIQALKRNFNIEKPYLLNVGVIQPRKNLQVLIQAFELFKKETNWSGKLIMAGKLGWKSKNFLSILENSIYKKDIYLLGYVSREDLAILYRNALAFIYPSVYEGFGLPVLEAMACGCPTIVSNSAALLEITNKATLAFNPYSINALLECLKGIVYEDNLRAKLTQAGLKKASKYTWEKTALETLRIYQSFE